MSVRRSVVIDAPPSEVWATLVAFERYGAWNPLIPRASGVAAVGETVRAVIAQPRFPPVPIRAEITRCDPERELAWETNLPGGGLLTVEHAFQLTPLDADGAVVGEGEVASRTEFAQVERVGGAVGRAVPDSLVGVLADGFDQMNRALRRRVETTHGGRGASADGSSTSASDTTPDATTRDDTTPDDHNR